MFKKKPKISLSTLLNCLDGITSQTGRIVFITANKKDTMPPVLIRPGRIDKTYLLDYADEQQIKSLFINFYRFPIPSTTIPIENYAEKFIVKLREVKGEDFDKITPSSLQGYFLKFKSHPSEAISNLDKNPELLE